MIKNIQQIDIDEIHYEEKDKHLRKTFKKIFKEIII